MLLYLGCPNVNILYTLSVWLMFLKCVRVNYRHAVPFTFNHFRSILSKGNIFLCNHSVIVKINILI